MKWYGKVGIIEECVEVEPGIYEDNAIVERMYCGEVKNLRFRFNNSNGINNDVHMTKVIEIIADPIAVQSAPNIAYVEYLGRLWKVEDATPLDYPRLSLTIGGVYNGNTPGTSN